MHVALAGGKDEGIAGQQMYVAMNCTAGRRQVNSSRKGVESRKASISGTCRFTFMAKGDFPPTIAK
ncbi:MAG: hypothetical protein IPM98_13525 [Lewinellaceae bacterium]|nr:hypothetical protein [Lewinellaceae bacterium]